MTVHPAGWILAFAVLAVGAAIQGTIGFGINLLAAPILVLIDPKLVPAPIIITSLALNLLVGQRDRGERPWHTMRWPIAGQVPACIAGAATIALISPTGLAVLFGILVLVAVGLSVVGRHPRPTPAVGFGAGLASGFMGTTTGIGGPPIAVVYQREQGPQMRATLSRFFGVGSIVALLSLLAFGELHLSDLWLAAGLLPGVLFGFWISRHTVHRLDRAFLRPLVLIVSAASAVVVMVRALV
jgi:uncharacterized membrane protein YfcA